MTQILNEITHWLATPQGNLLYSAVLGICALGGLVVSWYAHGNSVKTERKRIQQALLVLLVVQVALFLLSWMAWLGLVVGHSFLPPLDRVIAIFSLVLIVWLWVFPEPKRWITGLIMGIEAIVVLAGIISVFLWQGQGAQALFTSSTMAGYAYTLSAIIVLVGLILLLWRRPTTWHFGIAMLVIILAGYLMQYLVPQVAGEYFWLVRLGEMLGYPFLLALPRRLVPSATRLSAVTGEVSAPVSPSRVDEKLIKAVIELRDERSPTQYYVKLTRLVAQLMDADVCLLMMPPKVGGQLIIPVGYNLRDDWEIDGFTVDGNQMPSLLSALQAGKPLQLDGNAPDAEVKTLTNELTLGRTAHLLEVPFKPRGTSTQMGLLVLSKPADPVWTESDATRLIGIVNALLLGTSQLDRKVSQPGEQAELSKVLQGAQAEAEKLRQENAILKAEYDRLASQTVDSTPKMSEGVASPEQTYLQDTITQLEARNRELESMVSRGRPSAEEVEQLRQELRGALADLARIPTTLSKSDQRMLEMQLSAVKHLDAMGPIELVNSIAQEFRQPLSSIIGYTDLLLSESVGLLGAMQRKFLERVKASTERLGMLMNELVQVLAIDGGKLDQTPTMVEIDSVIEEAVASIKAQITEKEISMRQDIPEKLPPIQVNRDALQQILTNLLQNACLASPFQGEIRLFAGIEKKENEPNYLLLSINDQGGGIKKSDLPRVFARRYKLENPLIQGVGDTGVGLAIVKSLVELLKGRIWVDTEMGTGSTFSVLLPVAAEVSIPPQSTTGATE